MKIPTNMLDDLMTREDAAQRAEEVVKEYSLAYTKQLRNRVTHTNMLLNTLLVTDKQILMDMVVNLGKDAEPQAKRVLLDLIKLQKALEAQSKSFDLEVAVQELHMLPKENLH